MDNIVTVRENPIVVADKEVAKVIVTGQMGPRGLSNISSATDVDKTNLVDGAVLVYSNTTTKWTATTLLEKQTVNAGFF